ncbi:uncharacterized protein ARMOST_11540 [Armillaria ostoyae]|uniref:Uncharacterized protein n=1 Tax=Armillaria ostoyae TaxID=47428 RepID=A0A284RHH7_ARMOS|nr:uncharacterized protein ARMOST_11540 [Armillaria ostoyae]
MESSLLLTRAVNWVLSAGEIVINVKIKIKPISILTLLYDLRIHLLLPAVCVSATPNPKATVKSAIYYILHRLRTSRRTAALVTGDLANLVARAEAASIEDVGLIGDGDPYDII